MRFFNGLNLLYLISSSYNSGWEASTIIGPPRVYPSYGDIRGAWAPAYSSGTKESLQLFFQTPVYITGVDIFETYCPGHICVIEAKVDGKFITLWKSPVDLGRVAENQHLHSKRKSLIFSPPIEPTYFKTDIIQLHLDCTYAPSWAEIDCAILRGLEYKEWTTETHKHFPPYFKAMVKTLLLINQSSVTASGQLWLPKPIIFIIIEYCSLDWTEPKYNPTTTTITATSTTDILTTLVQQENTDQEESNSAEKRSKCVLS